MTAAPNDAKLFEIMYTCRAMRRLRSDPVPDDVLLQLVDAALQGPSGSNAQHWTIIIVKDVAQKRKIQEIWRRTWGFYADTFRNAEARPGEDLAQRERAGAAGSYMVEHLHEAPAIIFVGVRRTGCHRCCRTHLTTRALLRCVGNGSYWREGCAPGCWRTPRPRTAGTESIVAARALVSAVLTTPQFFVPGEFEAVLGTPRNVTLHAAIPVGYPRGKFGPITRPPAKTVVHWDRYRP
jgi:nitroreductase